jgi:hypothetical protein
MMMSVPKTIAPEAAARLAELGMVSELQRMIDYLGNAGAALRSVEVTLAPPCDPGDDPRIILEVTKGTGQLANDLLWRQWRDWMVDTFPSDVLRHFNLLIA